MTAALCARVLDADGYAVPGADVGADLVVTTEVDDPTPKHFPHLPDRGDIPIYAADPESVAP